MIVQLLQNDSAQAILLFGDLAYADDYNGYSTGQRNGYQPRWDTWGQMMQPIISHLPFLSLMGRLPFTLAFLPFAICFLPFALSFPSASLAPSWEYVTLHMKHIAGAAQVASCFVTVAVASAHQLNCVPENVCSRSIHDVLLLQVTMKRRVSSDMVMITWTPLTVRPTGKCPLPLGVMAPPSVPCHTGEKKAFCLSSLLYICSAAGIPVQSATKLGD